MTTRDFTMIADEELKFQAEKLYDAGFRVEVVNSQSIAVSLNRRLFVLEVLDIIGDSFDFWFSRLYNGKSVLMMTLDEAARLGLWSE